MAKPRVYFEAAPEDHDPADSGWYVHTVSGGVSVRQGYHSWSDAYRHAYLFAATEGLGL